MLRDELLAMADYHQRDGARRGRRARCATSPTRLSEWCGEGTYAYLLDRETTVPTDSPLVVFDTRRCPQDVLRPVMFSIMEYVTGTVERHWHAHTAPAPHSRTRPRFAGRSIMLIDEAWHLVRRRRDRRVRQRPRAPRPPPRAGADRDDPAALATSTPSTASRCCSNSTQQLLLAQHPSELGVHAARAAALRRESASSSAA